MNLLGGTTTARAAVTALGQCCAPRRDLTCAMRVHVSHDQHHCCEHEANGIPALTDRKIDEGP
jgi:hypothetical protein